MKAVDVAGLPIKLGAAVRGARVFHPHGVLAAGVLTRVAEGGFGLPIESGEVVARVSKGAGTPGDLPDVVGLAIRMDPHEGDDTAWDILLASALGDGGWSKIIPFPTRSLRDAKLSTLRPLTTAGTGGGCELGLCQGLRMPVYRWLMSKIRSITSG